MPVSSQTEGLLEVSREVDAAGWHVYDQTDSDQFGWILDQDHRRDGAGGAPVTDGGKDTRGVDKFRIKIGNQKTGATIYDNQLNG